MRYEANQQATNAEWSRAAWQRLMRARSTRRWLVAFSMTKGAAAPVAWQEAKVYSYVYSRQGCIRVYTHDGHEHSLGRTGRCTLGMVSAPWLAISATLIASCLDACARRTHTLTLSQTYPTWVRVRGTQTYAAWVRVKRRKRNNFNSQFAWISSNANIKLRNYNRTYGSYFSNQCIFQRCQVCQKMVVYRNHLPYDV